MVFYIAIKVVFRNFDVNLMGVMAVNQVVIDNLFSNVYDDFHVYDVMDDIVDVA